VGAAGESAVKDRTFNSVLPFADEVKTIMPEALTAYERVQINGAGSPVIAGTNMKVVELVMAQIAHGIAGPLSEDSISLQIFLKNCVQP
jgi:hypothetical protein